MVEQLGHYKILDRIGAGGLGEVYRARDTRLGRTVAVKLPADDLQRDGARLARLASDARAASVLSHPNIAALYEISNEGGQVFLVFEYVPGEPLERVIAGRPLNVRRAVDLATQIADALADGHAADLPHGRLTPDTIMVTPKGNAKILDYGFAAWSSHPPASAADAPSDIRALGAVMFEMLTGKAPAGGATNVGAGVPPDLSEVVRKALDPRAGAGYEAAATCAAELRSVAAMLDVRAAEAEPVRPPRPRPARGSRTWIVIAIVAAIVAAVLLWRFL